MLTTIVLSAEENDFSKKFYFSLIYHLERDQKEEEHLIEIIVQLQVSTWVEKNGFQKASIKTSVHLLFCIITGRANDPSDSVGFSL